MMEIVQSFKCKACGELIEPNKGKIVQGNIYMVGEKIYERGGLLGGSNYYDMNFKSVSEVAYCDKCFLEALCIKELEEKKIEKESDKIDNENDLLDFIKRNYQLGSLRECLMNGRDAIMTLSRDNKKCAAQIIIAMDRYLELKKELKEKKTEKELDIELDRINAM